MHTHTSPLCYPPSLYPRYNGRITFGRGFGSFTHRGPQAQKKEENDNNNLGKLNEEVQKINGLIGTEKKNIEETQEGILEMIKIMNDRMKNDIQLEKKERLFFSYF